MIMSNEIVKNKVLYKIFLWITKYVPILLFLVQIFLTAMNYMGIACPIITCIAGSSFVFLGLLLLISYVFRYCYLYRIPIWGTFIIGFLIVLRISGLLPIDLLDFYRIIAVISGLVISLYIIVAYKNRNKPKRDYIKEFCDRYYC